MAPTGYIIFYLIGVILMYLILSQFFIAIIVSAYDAANQEEEEHDREMRLMPGLLELHPPLGRRVLHSIVYFFSGYSLDYACFMPGVRLARVLDDLSDELNDRPGVSEKLVPMEEVKKKLSSSGFSSKTIDAVIDTYGQLQDFVAPENSAAPEENSSFNEGLLDSLTLKEVLNGQAKMLRGQDEKLSQLQRSVELLTENVATLSRRRRRSHHPANSTVPDASPYPSPR